jgi:hypothetical protein
MHPKPEEEEFTISTIGTSSTYQRESGNEANLIQLDE